MNPAYEAISAAIRYLQKRVQNATCRIEWGNELYLNETA
jgi:hypothetical protein